MTISIALSIWVWSKEVVVNEGLTPHSYEYLGHTVVVGP